MNKWINIFKLALIFIPFKVLQRHMWSLPRIRQDIFAIYEKHEKLVLPNQCSRY